MTPEYVRCIKTTNYPSYPWGSFGIEGSVYRVRPDNDRNGLPQYYLLMELVGYMNKERFEPVVIVKDSL
jgi:hypothetical protein